ncbi:MAG: RHS repeat-associated core domain-containing protein [Myxococcaceae bacterium]|nr:RHS repeat-associated core domain-containing protein [Myxococcaceae bacterium]
MKRAAPFAGLLIALLASSSSRAQQCPTNPDPECEGKCGKCRQGIAIGDPVNALSLDSYVYQDDVRLKTSLGPIQFARRYTSSDVTYNDISNSGALLTAPSPFGNTGQDTMRWSHSYFAWATDVAGQGYIDFRMPSGGWRRFARCSIPDGGTHCWAAPHSSWEGEENHVRRLLNGIEFFDEDGRVFIFNKPWHTGANPRWFLGEVYDTSGRKLATVDYGQPKMLDGGTCRLSTDAGVPYVSRITSHDSTSLVLTYDGVYNSRDFSPRWECGLVRVAATTDGGSGETVAQYTYVPDSLGRPTAGYLASATMGSLTETYNYDGGFSRSRGGALYARHVNAGNIVGTSEGEGPQTTFAPIICNVPPSPACNEDSINISRCCSSACTHSVQRSVISTTSRGDGTGQSASYERTYSLNRPNDAVHSLYPIKVKEQCSPATSCSAGSQLYLWGEPGKSPDDGCVNGNLAREVLHIDKRKSGTYTPYVRAYGGGYPYPQWEKEATQWGKYTDGDGKIGSPIPPFLEAEFYTYRYATSSTQALSTVTRSSTFAGAPTVTTELQYESASNNVVNAVFHSGQTRDIDGNPQNEVAAVFFGRDAGRLVEIQGPCFSPTGSACASGEPLTRFDYFPPGSGSSSGRLHHVYRYSGGVGSSTPLVTEYLGYSALGDPIGIRDENLKVHAFTWVGRELRSYLPPDADAGWTFAWENGEITSVQYPEGNFEVFCHKDDGSPESGGCTGTWTKKVQWRARSQDSAGANWSERVVYGWKNDRLKSERRFVNDSSEPRLVRFYDEDAEDRPTWERTGLDAGGYLTKRFFDGAGNFSGLSQPMNAAAPDFCGGPAGSVLCSWLEHDRANRPAIFDVYPNGAEPGIRTCIDYDAQSNVKRIATGCSATLATRANGCEINQGGASSSCSVPSDYVWDDFGNIVEAKVANLGDGGTSVGSVRYEVDARGQVIKKRTNEGTTVYTRDALGRLTSVAPQGGGATFILSYDSASFSGCGLTATGQAGRLAKIVDAAGMWETLYSYDGLGRLLHEHRRPSGAFGCPGAVGTTAYTYNRNGNVKSVTYPHGRQVLYTYGASLGLQSRVAQVDVNYWNGTVWSGTTTLASSVKWEPFGGLRGYHLRFPATSTFATVEYIVGDDGTQNLPGGGCAATAPVTSAGSYDGTGRLRSLRVTSAPTSTPTWQTGSGDIFKRGYVWKGDVVGRIDTCYPSMTTPIREEMTYDNAMRLTRVDMPNFATTGGFGSRHAFSYDSRSNRQTWHVGDGGVHVGYTYAGGNTPDRLVEEKPLSGTVTANRYGLDRDGRRTSRTWVDYAGNLSPVVVQSMTHDLGYGPDTAITELTVQGLSYVYVYDLFGRRTRKSYPTSDADKFIYAPGGVEMLEDVGVTAASVTSSFPIDDYIWLGGRPIAQLRGKLNASEGRTSPADYSRGACERLGDGTRCDFHFLITDHVGKPVLMLDSSRRIAGVGEHEPFGRVNTVETWQGIVPSTSSATTAFSSMSQANNGLNLQMRPHFHTIDLESNTCGSPFIRFKSDIMDRKDNTRWLDSATGPGRVNQRLSWASLTPHVNANGVNVGSMNLELRSDNQNCPRGVHQTSCSPTCSPATAYSGVQTRSYEYRRYESAAKWATNLSWKQTTSAPAGGWLLPGFNDSSWSAATEQIAHGGWPWVTAPQFPVGTTAKWIWYYDSRFSGDTSTVYFRKSFTALGNEAVLTASADDSLTIYVNGIEVASSYDYWWNPIAVRVQLNPGVENVIAVRVTNNGGPGGLALDVNETTTPVWTALRFPGQYYDAESDLHYNGFRFYEPSGGTYLQPEPILRDPRAQVAYAYDGHALPAYSYALNNPSNFVDPTGWGPEVPPGSSLHFRMMAKLAQGDVMGMAQEFTTATGAALPRWLALMTTAGSAANRAAGQCSQVARNLYDGFSRMGQNPQYVQVLGNSGRFMSWPNRDGSWSMVSNNGWHTAVKVGDRIYDAYTIEQGGMNWVTYSQTMDYVGKLTIMPLPGGPP